MKKLDYFGNEIILPQIGDKVLRDGYVFTVSEVTETGDIYSIASISMRGEAGTVGVGYYDFLKHQKHI